MAAAPASALILRLSSQSSRTGRNCWETPGQKKKKTNSIATPATLYDGSTEQLNPNTGEMSLVAKVLF